MRMLPRVDSIRCSLALGAAIVFCNLVTSNELRAAVILSNYPQTNDNGRATITQSNWRAIEFTTSASSAYSVDSLTVRLANFDASDTATIKIVTDSGVNTPSTNVIGSFTAPAGQGTSVVDYPFSPTASFSLQPNTVYWIEVAGGSSSTNYSWTTSSPTPVTPTGVATYDMTASTTNSGASWASTSSIYTFSLTGSAVPEPRVWVLTGLGLGILLRARRKPKSIS